MYYPTLRVVSVGGKAWMGLISIAWFANKIFVLGGGALWNVTLP